MLFSISDVELFISVKLLKLCYHASFLEKYKKKFQKKVDEEIRKEICF